MRSIRSCYGAEWLKKYLEAEMEGREPPPNPLQHASPKTTRRHYASKVPNKVELKRALAEKRAGKKMAKEQAATNSALAISDATPRKSPRLQTNPGR